MTDEDVVAADEGLTRSQLLARGGAVGLALAGTSMWARSRLAPEVADAATFATAPPRIKQSITRPELRPPLLTIRHPARGVAEGLLFIAPTSGAGQRGTLIFDNQGEPVWFHRTGVTATAFRAWMLKGKPVLSWWEGTYSREGLGRGVYVFLDDSYREIARVRADGKVDGDLHELTLTREGTALITKNVGRRMDARAWGGSANSLVWGGIVQEIDLPSGRVLFEWNSFDHVDLAESHGRANHDHFDYFHVNSVDEDADGNLIVSARNTWTIYKIHRRTGKVIWRLGGRKSDFKMGPGTVTAWQHDARAHGGGRLISVFDNGAAPQVQTQSRPMVVRLDTARMTATLERAFKHRPNRIVSKFMGSAQLLPDGGMVSGWGSEPFVTEFAPDGSIRFEAVMPKGSQNYRAFRLPWKGKPVTSPVMARGLLHGKRGIWASWNGATEVDAWVLRYGPTIDDLSDGQPVKRTGFDTYLGPRPSGTRFAGVVALDASGNVLGRSRVAAL